MAFSVNVGGFAQPGSTGNQAITGVGFQPKAVLFFMGDPTSDGSTIDLRMGLGFGISSTDRWAVSDDSDDGINPPDGSRRHDDSKCITLTDISSVVAAADLVSMDSDGFTINWTTVDATARRVTYVAVGGADLTNIASVLINASASTGDQAITGVGFQPGLVLFSHAAITAAPPGTFGLSRLGLGAAVSSAERWCMATHSAGSGAASDTARMQLTDACIVTHNVSVVQGRADFVSMDSDGFTINWSTAISGMRIRALCLRGGNFKLGSFSQPASTGNQAITGVGFQPKGEIFTSFNNVASGSVTAGSRRTVGIAQSSTARASRWAGDEDGANPSVADSDLDEAASIKMMTEGTPTVDAEADFVSHDSDGFTNNWSTADATARQVLYLAMGSSAARRRVGFGAGWSIRR